MDLRFDHPHRAAQFLGRRNRFGNAERRKPARNRRAEGTQNLFCLVFVNVHGETLPGAETRKDAWDAPHNSSRLSPRKRFALVSS
jgi:hypothetical protein